MLVIQRQIFNWYSQGLGVERKGLDLNLEIEIEIDALGRRG